MHKTQSWDCHKEIRKHLRFYHALLLSTWALLWFTKNIFITICLLQYNMHLNCVYLCIYIHIHYLNWIYAYIYHSNCAHTHTHTHTHTYHHQHGYPWPSLTTPPYRPLLLTGPQGYILYLHWAAVCRFELVILPLLVHVRGSTGVHDLWACPYFSSSVLHVWLV